MVCQLWCLLPCCSASDRRSLGRGTPLTTNHRPTLLLAASSTNSAQKIRHVSDVTTTGNSCYVCASNAALVKRILYANYFSDEIELLRSMPRTYVVKSFHRQLVLRREFLGIGNLAKSLSFRCPFSSSMLTSVCLTFRHGTMARLIKNNSNHIAALLITRCAPPVSPRVVDSLRHTHVFSRVTLREFLVKWATMAAHMVIENVVSILFF